MATIMERVTKDGKKRYTVQIRLKGARPITQTFDTKTQAKSFVQATEADIRRGVHAPVQEAQRRTFADLADRYEETVLPQKSASTAYSQGLQLRYWRDRLGHMTLATITGPVIADERDHLLKGQTTRVAAGKKSRNAIRKPKKGEKREPEVKSNRTPATVVRYLAVLSHCLTYAQKELGWIVDNPARNVSKPKEPRGRVRFLSEKERAALLKACADSQNPHLHDIVVLALSTGARRGEIQGLEWRHIDFNRRVIVLDETKNGERRVIPIRGQAEKLLRDRHDSRREDTPFAFPSPYHPKRTSKPIDIQNAWDWALERAKIQDFKFHDLRHSAASYLAMNGATLVELAEVLGHKTLAMVKRYSHLAEDHTGALLERMNDAIFAEVEEESGKAVQ